MKRLTNHIFVLFVAVLFSACDNETERLFEKSADQRVAEAISNLRGELTRPANGWRVKYQPEDGSGAYWVLLDFKENGELILESDLGANDGEFFRDTLTYRVDNSLGLELILETYTFFHYLFEQDGATFAAEYEYIYQNKTPDGSLVFTSKSDPGTPTVLVFEEGQPDDEQLLGREVSENINLLADDISGLLFASPSYVLTYTNKDLQLYLSMDGVHRTLSITGAAKKSTSSGAESINFSTGYYLQGDSIILLNSFNGTHQGINLNFSSLYMASLTDATVDLCGGKDIHQYEGVTNQNDPVILAATLDNPGGAAFNQFDFLISPVDLIFNNGTSAEAAITTDLVGAQYMQLYYNNDGFYALGFYMQNTDGTTTWYLRQFTAQKTGNNVVFDFAPTTSVFGNTNSPANINNVNAYLEAFTQGDATYFYEIADGIYEMNNPCTGWSAVFYGI